MRVENARSEGIWNVNIFSHGRIDQKMKISIATSMHWVRTEQARYLAIKSSK